MPVLMGYLPFPLLFHLDPYPVGCHTQIQVFPLTYCFLEILSHTQNCALLIS
jgi:hypothetical protein